MKNLSEALEAFDEEVNKIRRELPENGKDSEEHYFGFKTNRGDELFMVVDFGNIKSFLKSTLISLLDEVVPEEDKPRWGSENAEHYRVESNGFNRCRRELIKKINEIKK